jgi:hypothetical protein
MAGSKKDGDRPRKDKVTGNRSLVCPPSTTPYTCERGRSLAWQGGNEIFVHERVIRNIVHPMLMSTNYIDWAFVIKMNLHKDMDALSMLLREVPP